LIQGKTGVLNLTETNKIQVDHISTKEQPRAYKSLEASAIPGDYWILRDFREILA